MLYTTLSKLSTKILGVLQLVVLQKVSSVNLDIIIVNSKSLLNPNKVVFLAKNLD